MPDTHEKFARERELLIRDKYNDNQDVDLMKLDEDVARLAAGEPLAYVIGWSPFLDLKIEFESLSDSGTLARPLIPRPETEWWTEKLIEHLRYKFNANDDNDRKPLYVLDLCAGSGAIGLAVLSHLPNAHVSFGEIEPGHAKQIKKNIVLNELDERRVDIQTGDLFEPFNGQTFDIIVSNPPYIPEGRILDASVVNYEPSRALFAGPDGLEVIRKIVKELPGHLNADGELWMECDITNIGEAESLLRAAGAETAIHEDLYGRPRLLVGHFE